MKKIAYIVFATVALVGCYKVDIHWNTDHPHYGRIILTTDWSKHSDEADVPPPLYMARLVDPTIMVPFTETRVEFPNLFEPGTYTLYFYNNAKGVELNGTVASLLNIYSPEVALGPTGPHLVDNPDASFVETPLSRGEVGEIGMWGDIYGGSLIGFQFWGSLTQTVEADRDYDVVVPMRQITRQLEFDFTITEGDPELISDNVGLTLSGIASAWDCEADKPDGYPSGMLVDVVRRGDKIVGMTRLLGMADGEKGLSLDVMWNEDREWDYVSQNVTDLLAGFNAKDRTSALVIKGNLHLSGGADRSVTLSDLTIEERAMEAGE